MSLKTSGGSPISPGESPPIVLQLKVGVPERSLHSSQRCSCGEVWINSSVPRISSVDSAAQQSGAAAALHVESVKTGNVAIKFALEVSSIGSGFAHELQICV